jgi:hypothetical protein
MEGSGYILGVSRGNKGMITRRKIVLNEVKKSFDKQNVMSNNRPYETAFGIIR